MTLGSRFPCLCMENQKTPRRHIETQVEEGKQGRMERKFIPAEESFQQWKKAPEYVAEYEALENEFATASASILIKKQLQQKAEE